MDLSHVALSTTGGGVASPSFWCKNTEIGWEMADLSLKISCCGAQVNSWMSILHVDLRRVDRGIASQSFWWMHYWNRLRYGWVIVEKWIFSRCWARWIGFTVTWKLQWIAEWTGCMSIYPRQVEAQHARHFGISYVEIHRKMIKLSSKIDVYPLTWGERVRLRQR
jgi:hypothetical protein